MKWLAAQVREGVTEEEIARIICRWTGIPVSKLMEGEREKLLDRLVWNKSAEIARFDVFNINQLLSLLVRLHIIARWNKLDSDEGARLFKQLVDQVRGTFKGINPEQI